MFWGPAGNQQLNFDGFTYIHYAAPPIQLASAPLTSSRLVEFRLPRATPGNEAERKIYRSLVKSLVLF